MALIACKECGKEVSDKAPACPGCGAPVVTTASAPIPEQTKAKRKTSPVTWTVLVLMIVGAVWYSQTRGYKEQSLPMIPVEVQHREALTGPGLVLRVNNTSDKPLVALVKIRNPTTQQEKSFRLDIPAKGSSEVGHREGWVLAPGDQLEVFNDAYRSWTGTIQ